MNRLKFRWFLFGTTKVMKMNDFELERLTAIQELIHAMNDAEREELNDCFVCCLLFVYIYTHSPWSSAVLQRAINSITKVFFCSLFSSFIQNYWDLYKSKNIFFILKKIKSLNTWFNRDSVMTTVSIFRRKKANVFSNTLIVLSLANILIVVIIWSRNASKLPKTDQLSLLFRRTNSFKDVNSTGGRITLFCE